MRLINHGKTEKTLGQSWWCLSEPWLAETEPWQNDAFGFLGCTGRDQMGALHQGGRAGCQPLHLLLPTRLHLYPPSFLFYFYFFLASQEGKECYHAGGKMLFFTQTENSCPCVDLFSIEIHKLAFWIYPSVSAMREGFFNVLTKPRFWACRVEGWLRPCDISQQDSERWLSPGGNKLCCCHCFFNLFFPSSFIEENLTNILVYT